MIARALTAARGQQARHRVRDYIRIHKVVLPPNAAVSVKKVQVAVCEHYGVLLVEMTSDRRAKRIARARQVAMYLCRVLAPLSLPAIARQFGDMDHSTVMHAIKRVERRLADGDTELAADLAALRITLS